LFTLQERPSDRAGCTSLGSPSRCMHALSAEELMQPSAPLLLVLKALKEQGWQVRARSFGNRRFHIGRSSGSPNSRVMVFGPALKSESAQKLTLESVSGGSWHCVAQYFENAAQHSAKLPERPILRSVSRHFLISGLAPKS
jgi:hypothetical protein